jgi:hypothetical protein
MMPGEQVNQGRNLDTRGYPQICADRRRSNIGVTRSRSRNDAQTPIFLAVRWMKWNSGWKGTHFPAAWRMHASYLNRGTHQLPCLPILQFYCYYVTLLPLTQLPKSGQSACPQ